VLAEYDALPDIGHACGHNIIATTALGAALALNSVASQLPGRVKLLGTPAEERGGGKELMARAGAFEGIDAALMIHPAGVNLATMPSICIAEVEVIYHGKASHASAMPHKGINALDGLPPISYRTVRWVNSMFERPMKKTWRNSSHGFRPVLKPEPPAAAVRWTSIGPV
jgi:amidohydrolase